MRVQIKLFTVLILLFYFWIDTLEAKEPRVLGDTLAFSLYDMNGNLVTSSDKKFKNKVLYVTIWGTWCPPCLSEIPTFIDLQERYEEQGLEIIAIAFERDSLAEIRQKHLRATAQKKQINYLILDGGHTSEFSDALPAVVDVKGLPIEIIIDRSGSVLKSRNGYGYSEEWAEVLEKEFIQLLQK
jgi:thiol-disulfide isomerase/thioredoxin